MKSTQITQNPPMQSLSSVTSTGFLLQPTCCSLQGRQWNCTHLPNTGQTTHPSANTSLHYISGPASTTITESKQRSLREVTTLFRRLSGGTDSWPMSGQQGHSPSSAKDSRLPCSDFTLTQHSRIPPNTILYILYIVYAHVCSHP